MYELSYPCSLCKYNVATTKQNKYSLAVFERNVLCQMYGIK